MVLREMASICCIICMESVVVKVVLAYAILVFPDGNAAANMCKPECAPCRFRPHLHDAEQEAMEIYDMLNRLDLQLT